MSKIAVRAYLLGLFSLSIFRAATQSFTTDEAYSYQIYVGATPFNLLHQFDANLHFLHTLATWAVVKSFGLTELTFRLPSLFGCALYLLAVERLARKVTPWTALLLTASPLLQDHMSVGRGYGLALAFLAWALVEATQENPNQRRFVAFLTLSVGSNLTFLFPAAGLIAVMMWRNRNLLLPSVTGPWLVFVILLWAIPFGRVTHQSFYFGASTLASSVNSLTESVTRVELPGVLAVMSCGAVLAYAAYRAWASRAAANSVEFVSAASVLVTSLAVLSSHMLFGFAYPFSRTGLYFLFLVPLCLTPLTRHAAGAVVLVALSLFQWTRVDPHSYNEWRFDASSNEIIRQIAEHHRDADGPERIACSQPMEWALSLYRDMRGLSWLSVEPGNWETADYLVVGPDDASKLAELHLREQPWSTVAQVRVGAR